MKQIERALEKASETFNVPIERILSPSRKRPAVLARQSLMVGLRSWGFSLKDVGRILDRDHVTVMHARKTYDAFSAVKGGAQREDYEKMREVVLFTRELGGHIQKRARWLDIRRHKRIMSNLNGMRVIDIIRIHAAELGRLLPEDHPEKAKLERMGRAEHLSPTGGSSTTNALKD